MISLEKTRVLSEMKKRDAFQQNIAEIEVAMQSWNTITNTLNPEHSLGVYLVASDEIKKLVEERDILQKQIIVLLDKISDDLDTGPFAQEANFQDIQTQFPIVQQRAKERLDAYESDIRKAEKAREEFLAQKRQELEQVTLDIERTRFVKKGQLS